MSPPFPRASVELDYPLYALDFDPEDARRLVVGGGGGAGRSGVGNKIVRVPFAPSFPGVAWPRRARLTPSGPQSVLEAAADDELRVAGELELSRDEDSVMSLAVGMRRAAKAAARIYAGVNSGPADLAKGSNRHLRALAVDGAAARVKVAEVSRTALFGGADADAYQRLLRVAGPLGAVASAMAREPQIAVFDAPAAAPPRLRGLLELPSDAEDLDLVQKGPDAFQLAYCHRHELQLVDIGDKNAEPDLVFTMPEDHGRRPVFRSIRYLSPDFLLAVANLPGRTGVLIQGFRLPTPGHDKARIAVTARIPRKVSATALAVANLSPPSPPWADAGATQFFVAVAGHDSSISLYTLEHRPSTVLNLLVDLWPLRTLLDVHGGGNITGLAFSRVVAPKARARGPSIRLASTSLQKTVAVHSIPLRRHVDGAARGGRGGRKGPPRPARHVVAVASRRPSSRPVMTVLALMVLAMALVGQAVMEAYGRSAPVLFAPAPLSSWHGALGPSRAAGPPPPAGANDVVARLVAAGDPVVLFEAAPDDGDAGIRVGAHDVASHGPARSWDELGADQKRVWRERLREAGAWTQGMGESVFKGILFGEIAGAIGRAMEG